MIEVLTRREVLMKVWFYAFAIKAALIPVIAFLYWVFVIKLGDSVVRHLPAGKLKDALTKDRTF